MREQVLDFGYVKLVESYGSDESIIEAARMSTDKGFLGWGGEKCIKCGEDKPPPEVADSCRGADRWSTDPLYCEHEYSFLAGDEKLLRFLYENEHNTPFEMGGMIIEVMAPIFVFREWHRHRTQSYNEMSARYTPLPDVNYIPSIERLLINANGANKQAGTIKGAGALTLNDAELFRQRLAQQYEEQESFYQWALKAGVPKELARIDLPVGRYSKMRANANLRNWLAFMTLRSAPNAQWEIRQYSHVLEKMIADRFPRTAQLWREGFEKCKTSN